MGLINAATGTILANQSTPLVIQPSPTGFTNNGTLTVNTSDLMHVLGGPFSNFSGSTLTGGTYNVSGTLEIDELGNTGGEILTDAAKITLTGASSSFVDSASKDALSNLASISSGGAFALAGSRNFTTAGNFTNNGILTVGAGSKFDVNGNLTNFSGTTLTGGTYSVSGTLQFNSANIVTNAANITITGPAGKITDQGGTINALANLATNTGSFNISKESLTTAGSLTNSGTFTVGKGATVTLGSAGSYTQTGGTTTVDGTFKSSVVTSAFDLNAGSAFGIGTLGFGVVDAGTLTPADSASKAGKLAVSGTYTENSTGALDIFISGTTAGTKYDQLNVTSTASLGGTLNISLKPGFVPTLGSTFDILNASSVAGTFATVNGTGINGSEHFTVVYNANNVTLDVVSGAASTSAGTAGVRQPAASLSHTKVPNTGLTLPGNSAVLGMPGRFNRDHVQAYQAGNRAFVFTMRDLLNASPAGAFRMARSAGGMMAPHMASVRHHSGIDHRRLEMGFDLLSLVGNPRGFMRSVFSEAGTFNATGLTYMACNGSR